MSHFYFSSLRAVFVVLNLALLASCGGGSGQSEIATQNVTSAAAQKYISGGGIKGPLAFASVELYALDTRFPELYDAQNPLATTATNAYAQITDLQVPSDIQPPYIMVIDGTNAIDLNTGQPPVIKKLVTIIATRALLSTGQSVYATPYTTLAYQMLRLENAQKSGSTPAQKAGNGLNATYYNDMSLSDIALKRVDDIVNFKWDRGSPASGVNNDRFSVRWTGYVRPEFSKTYTFYTSTDDGVRLWVDGKLLINHWSRQSVKTYSGTIKLVANKKYPIVMEYYDATYSATAKLSWKAGGQQKTVIPHLNLYRTEQSAGRESIANLPVILSGFNEIIIQSATFGMSPGADIFTTPPIVTADTISVKQQKVVVHYRAAIEALSAMLNEMSLASNSVYSTDTLLQLLAQDLYSDGAIDGAKNGVAIREIDMALLQQDPMLLYIPNTQYQVSDITTVMNEERALVGDSSSVVYFSDSVPVNLQPIAVDPAIENPPKTDYNSDVGSLAKNLVVTGGLLGSSSGIASPCATTDAIFCVDHENIEAGHHVTDADIKKWFLVRTGITNDKTGGAIDIVADPTGDPARGNVMRIFNSKGARGFTDGVNGPSSGQWRSWPGAHNELYFSYDFYMEPGRAWTKGQKLPGLMGGDWGAGSGGSKGGSPDGTNGFSARLMMFSKQAYPGKGNGALAQYTYSTNAKQRVRWYNGGSGGQVNLERGKWYTIESYIKLNTPGVANGLMKAWVNGVQVLEHKKVKWRTVSRLKLDGVFFTFGYGGGNDSWNASEDQYNYYDNWTLSTQPITH